MFSALSGLLFFWLVVQHSMKNSSNSRNDEEKLFVNSWCLIGNYLLLLLFWFFFNVALFEALSFWVFSVFAQFFGFLILFLLFGSLPLLISWKYIQFYRSNLDEEEKRQMILSFIPFFSSYCWFSVKQFDTPNFWLKEAQLWFFIFWLLLFFFNSWMVALVFGGFLILRIVFLLIWWDVFSVEQKQRMKHWFLVYPEESFSVVYTFIRQGFSLLMDKTEVSVEDLLKYQASYRSPWNITTYLLTFLFWLWIFAFVYYWRSSWLYWKVIPILWLLIRTCILFFTRTKIPKMPLVAEITA